MAKSETQVNLPVPVNHAYVLVRESGNQIPKFRPLVEDPGRYTLRWQRGWGWTNPIDVRATVHDYGGQSVVHYEASILALADPFGFTNKTLEQFATHLQNYLRAQQTGAPLAPPPTEERSIWVNLGIIGCVFAAVLLVILIVVLAAVLGR